MIFKRKREKVKEIIMNNLTYCRLKGDLLAVEASIRDSAPRTVYEDGSAVKRFINGIINEINNAARTLTVHELSVDKARAERALASFRACHSEKELALSENTEELKRYINKKLFKNDKDGLRRIAFALVFAIDERNQEYQCPEDSLEVVSEILFDDPKRLGHIYSLYKRNYTKILKPFPGDFESGMGLGTGLGGALAMSLLPMSVTGLLAIVGYVLNKRANNAAFANMSPSELNASLAFRLTVLEAATELSDKKRKEMIDELLEHVGNVRADAEYRWFVEGDNIPECREKIETCDLTLARLGKILGV